MDGRLWLQQFTSVINSEPFDKTSLQSTEWTEFMESVMDRIAERTTCKVIHRHAKDTALSKEYLNIDALFFTEAAISSMKKNQCCPFVFPQVAVELENMPNWDKIAYCLWKVLCIQAKTKVLICYQKEIQITGLKDRLEEIIVQGGFMKEADEDLIVIIGVDGSNSASRWSEWFSVFRWQNNQLEKVQYGGLKW